MHPTVHTGCAARKSLDLQACCFLELKPDRLLMQTGTVPESHSAIFEQGLAEHRGQRVVLARNLLATLRGRELAKAAQEIATETGLEHRPVADGQHVTGIYRRSVMLASGLYAMLDDVMGFSLVPWKPVIEQRLGQQIAATVRGAGVTWEIGRMRAPSVG